MRWWHRKAWLLKWLTELGIMSSVAVRTRVSKLYDRVRVRMICVRLTTSEAAALCRCAKLQSLPEFSSPSTYCNYVMSPDGKGRGRGESGHVRSVSFFLFLRK